MALFRGRIRNQRQLALFPKLNREVRKTGPGVRERRIVFECPLIQSRKPGSPCRPCSTKVCVNGIPIAGQLSRSRRHRYAPISLFYETSNARSLRRPVPGCTSAARQQCYAQPRDGCLKRANLSRDHHRVAGARFDVNTHYRRGIRRVSRDPRRLRYVLTQPAATKTRTSPSLKIATT